MAAREATGLDALWGGTEPIETVGARLLHGWIHGVRRGAMGRPTTSQCVRHWRGMQRWFGLVRDDATAPVSWTRLAAAYRGTYGCAPDDDRGPDAAGHRRVPTEADVDRLLGVCRTPRERALVTLLSTAAPRIGDRPLLHERSLAGAIADLGRADVWDDCVGDVRDRWEIVEKLGRIRVIVPRPALRVAMRELLRSTGADRRWVFEVRSGRRPTERGLSKVLMRLCQRAGMPDAFGPHRFRAHVVGGGDATGCIRGDDVAVPRTRKRRDDGPLLLCGCGRLHRAHIA